MEQAQFALKCKEIWDRAEVVLDDMYRIVGQDEDGDPVPFHFHSYGELVIKQIERLIDLYEEMTALEAKANRMPEIRLKSFRDFLRVLSARPK